MLGNYDPAVPLALLLEFIVPPWQAGTSGLAQATLARDESDGAKTRHCHQQDIVVSLAETYSTPLNERVMNIVEKVGAFKLGSKALETAQSGDRRTATVRLRQVTTLLLNLGEPALAEAMLVQAKVLEGSW